jgi:hypothetical protein
MNYKYLEVIDGSSILKVSLGDIEQETDFTSMRM